jgi:hypothetical protein
MTMSRARMAKQKGRLGQQEIRDAILAKFPELEPDDVKSTTMGDGGEDIQLSPAARRLLPITIEVKRRKSGMKIAYDFIAQAKAHKKGEPVVCFRADRQDWIVMVGLDHYLELIRRPHVVPKKED